MMLSRRIVRASPTRLVALAANRSPIVQQRRTFLPDQLTGRGGLMEEKYPDSDYPQLTDAEDPEMNGGYINPPRIKRQFRDPYAKWWDPQERRNFGEPVHEDHDLLGMFSPYEYTWVSPGKGLAQIGAFIVAFLGLCYGVKLTYPDKVSYPREFEDGLLQELGGSGAVRARRAGDPDP
ncbi:NADH:ubiquinone oxidoreductase 20.1kD subunit [Neurospora crassa]|nr:NADH:ubiquinone oxidoreductase 20.1kD subunit [Neurospora crassa]